jgi:multidrug efflux pump subunit AcrB
MVGVYGLGKVMPTGFLPEGTRGAFFIVIQLPTARRSASTDVVQQVESVLKQEGRSRITAQPSA